MLRMQLAGLLVFAGAAVGRDRRPRRRRGRRGRRARRCAATLAAGRGRRRCRGSELALAGARGRAARRGGPRRRACGAPRPDRHGRDGRGGRWRGKAAPAGARVMERSRAGAVAARMARAGTASWAASGSGTTVPPASRRPATEGTPRAPSDNLSDGRGQPAPEAQTTKSLPRRARRRLAIRSARPPTATARATARPAAASASAWPRASRRASPRPRSGDSPRAVTDRRRSRRAGTSRPDAVTGPGARRAAAIVDCEDARRHDTARTGARGRTRPAGERGDDPDVAAAQRPRALLGA